MFIIACVSLADHTFGKIVDGELALWITRQVPQRNIRFTFSYHKVHDDE
jgi:hypothetical protein